jgi:flagellar protein FliS
MPPQNAYLESQILTADPLELVRLLYRAARDAMRRASLHLAAGRIAERSREISKAHAILVQLCGSLDHARGGTLSRSLAELYDYMQRRLLEANVRQAAAPLAEAENLLGTLLEGWDQIPTVPERGAPYRNLRPPPDADLAAEYGGYAAVLAPYAAAGYASQSWTF